MDFVPTLNRLSWQSRSFTEVETTPIIALYQGLVSFGHLKFLRSACAIAPKVKNGAADVDVQQTSSFTLDVITPYGTLLLLLRDAVDASTVASVMNFTKEFTKGVHLNMNRESTLTATHNVDNPLSATQRLKELEETSTHLYALREIADTSEDPESVRVAFVALISTQAGLTYLQQNPVVL